MKKTAILVGVICVSIMVVFAVTNEEQDVLKKIMPGADSFNKKSMEGVEYFEAKKGDSIIGYCVEAAFKGYKGSIRMIAGIDPNGVIQDVEILENNEMPGFGTRINERSFLGQFKGKSADTVSVGKNIDAVTGATISSKAMTDAMDKTVGEFISKIKR